MKLSTFLASASKSASTTNLIIMIAAMVPLTFGVAEAWLENRWLTLVVTFSTLCCICFVYAIVRIWRG